MGAMADTIFDYEEVQKEGEAEDYQDGEIVGPGEGFEVGFQF